MEINNELDFVSPDKLVYSEESIIRQLSFLNPYLDGHNGFIAGGCFKNIFRNEKIKDVDIFFRSEEDFDKAKLYYQIHRDYVFSYENKNTISYLNTCTGVRVELIRNTYGSPEKILADFDFSIVKFAYYDDINCRKCVYHDKFFEHLTLKKLVLNKEIKYPISTWNRTYRYAKYGYGLCRESKANLIIAMTDEINNIDIADEEDSELISLLGNELYFGID